MTLLKMSSTKRKIEETVTRPYLLKLDQQHRAIHEFVDRDSTSIVMQYMPEMPSDLEKKMFICPLSDINCMSDNTMDQSYVVTELLDRGEFGPHKCSCRSCKYIRIRYHQQHCQSCKTSVY
jgi:hypothetical protein